MANYHIESDSGVHTIIEKKSKAVMSFKEFQKAAKLVGTMNKSGAGFNGNTPDFFTLKYPEMNKAAQE